MLIYDFFLKLAACDKLKLLTQERNFSKKKSISPIR